MPRPTVGESLTTSDSLAIHLHQDRSYRSSFPPEENSLRNLPPSSRILEEANFLFITRTHRGDYCTVKTIMPSATMPFDCHVEDTKNHRHGRQWERGFTCFLTVNSTQSIPYHALYPFLIIFSSATQLFWDRLLPLTPPRPGNKARSNS